MIQNWRICNNLAVEMNLPSVSSVVSIVWSQLVCFLGTGYFMIIKGDLCPNRGLLLQGGPASFVGTWELLPLYSLMFISILWQLFCKSFWCLYCLFCLSSFCIDANIKDIFWWSFVFHVASLFFWRKVCFQPGLGVLLVSQK